MLYREIIAVCSQIHTKHINTLCGQNVELLNVKLAVYKVTAGLSRVNNCLNLPRASQILHPAPLPHPKYPLKFRNSFNAFSLSPCPARDINATHALYILFWGFNVMFYVEKLTVNQQTTQPTNKRDGPLPPHHSHIMIPSLHTQRRCPFVPSPYSGWNYKRNTINL